MPNAARLFERFIRYVRCGSETRNEQNFALMIEKELDALGISHHRENLDRYFYSNGWNIYAKVPGDPALPPILFVLHLDTVAPGEGIKPIIENDVIRSSGNTILGADGKAGIAIVLEALERLQEAGISHRPVEFLFTVCQEADLNGAKYAKCEDIVSQEAVLLDHTTFAEIACESPEKLTVTYEISGKKSHAAMDHADGVNALKTAVEIIHGIPLGRVDLDSIINIGDFVALSPTNVVPDHVRYDLEIRSFSPQRLKEYETMIKERTSTICRQYGASYSTTVVSRSPHIVTEENAGLVRDMLRAMADVGVTGKLVRTFGQSDSTRLQPRGITCINLGVGSQNLHSTQESISCGDMEQLVQVIRRFLQAGNEKGMTA